jgi:excisionase family DNA binding protein
VLLSIANICLKFFAIVSSYCYFRFNHMTVWLNLDDLARYLKVPKSTLYRLAQKNALPGHKVGRTWRFDRDEVDQWIKSHRDVLPDHEGKVAK